jgi:hypothetical protein
MSIRILNNGETLGIIRGKINDNFADLAATPIFSDELPACSATVTGNFSVAHSTATAIPFNVTIFKTVSGMHDETTNNTRFIIPQTGIYLFSYCLNFLSNNTGARTSYFQINGTTLFAADRMTAVQDATTILQRSSIQYLIKDSYVELVVNQTSGGSLDLSKQDYAPLVTIQAIRLGAI